MEGRIAFYERIVENEHSVIENQSDAALVCEVVIECAVVACNCTAPLDKKHATLNGIVTVELRVAYEVGRVAIPLQAGSNRVRIVFCSIMREAYR